MMQISSRMLDSEPMQRCKLRRCKAACCLYGVWLDEEEAALITSNADLILPHLDQSAQDPAGWLDGRKENDPFSRSGKVLHSTVIEKKEHYGGSACIFLRADHKCALQVAGESAGFHPWHFKPFYCILHPLDLDEEGRITLDETHYLLEEEASCLRPSLQPIPLIITFEPELRYLLGDETYSSLAQIKQKQTR